MNPKKTFRQGGVHPEENKLSSDKPIITFPIPKQVIIPLGQCLGAPAEAIVKKGDEIKEATIQTCVVVAPEQTPRPEGIDMGIYYNEEDPTKVTLSTFAAAKIVNENAKNITVKATLAATRMFRSFV